MRATHAITDVRSRPDPEPEDAREVDLEPIPLEPEETDVLDTIDHDDLEEDLVMPELTETDEMFELEGEPIGEVPLDGSFDRANAELTAIREAVQSMSGQMNDLKQCLLLLIASRDYYGWSKWDSTERERMIVQNDETNKDTYGVEPEEMMHMRWITRAREILRAEWPDHDPLEPQKRPDQHPSFDR